MIILLSILILWIISGVVLTFVTFKMAKDKIIKEGKFEYSPNDFQTITIVFLSSFLSIPIDLVKCIVFTLAWIYGFFRRMFKLILFLSLFFIVCNTYGNDKVIQRIPNKTYSQTYPVQKRYVLKLILKQVHYNLSISDYVKDNWNKIYFELPVDKIFYDKVNVNDELINNFRSGSLFLHGSFGKWKLIVIGKKIVNY